MSEFGKYLHEMDVEAFFNIRDWLQKAVEAAGAEVTGKGIGMGQADLDISLNGAPFAISIKPLPMTAKAQPTQEETQGKGRNQ